MKNTEWTISKCPYSTFLQSMQWLKKDKIFSLLLWKQSKNLNKELTQLFQVKDLDTYQRIKRRPLWEISDILFNKDKMNAQHIERLVEEFSLQEFDELTTEDQELGLFDLKMLYSKLIHDHSYNSMGLRDIIKEINTKLWVIDSPIPQYNDLIFLNPKEDVRTFLDWKAWYQEYQFYLWHTLIEKEFEHIVSHLENVMVKLHQHKKIHISKVTSIIKKHFEISNQYMLMYNKKFNKMHFNQFRDYFNIPDKMLKSWEESLWPSWVNMWSMVIINHLIQWKNLNNTMYKQSFWNQNIGAHPRKDQQRISVLRDWGWFTSLLDLAEHQNMPELKKLCDTINKHLILFLQIHQGTVKKFLPEAYKEWIWTWWFPIKESLENSIYQKKQFSKEITETFILSED